ncbi:hypothetical protein G4Y73_03120 [Wenzhouxiangella sp. XN201]|uniref:hypothetical protein n=1 Tax=Wenzhouxiangella sp. XN201 TaxID=2710755 RepID=UPI0013C72F67|nr:hypothetical protein [Wenzhouxiangella sp. XN201]NEZ03140.1 hypothetical protein [Wenzhouxiangella sp. XN201]
MSALIGLWLPIVITTVVLFFASFLAWAISPHHKPDVRKWPDEDRLLEFIRASDAPPGEYLFPMIDEKDMKEDWAKQRYAAGPWGMVNVWPAQPNMGANMVKTVLFFLIVTIVIAHLGTLTLPAGASFERVFHIVGLIAVLAHTTGGICREIWFTRPLRAKVMDVVDGVVYGLITGLTFALMWP